MRPLLLSLLLLGPATAAAADCGSIVPSVCVMAVEDLSSAPKMLKVKPGVTPFLVGDRFPVESRSLLMDPARYGLDPSDGSWRYYAMAGVVYRIENGTGLVLEVIRSRGTAYLR